MALEDGELDPGVIAFARDPDRAPVGGEISVSYPSSAGADQKFPVDDRRGVFDHRCVAAFFRSVGDHVHIEPPRLFRVAVDLPFPDLRKARDGV